MSSRPVHAPEPNGVGPGLSRKDRIRIAFLAPDDISVPPPIPGASVSRVVHELARWLPEDRFDVIVCALPHPSISDGMHEGIRYLHVESRLDALRHRALFETVRAIRRLDLPYRPMHGVPFYATGYARKGLRRLAEFRPDIVVLQNASQFLPIARKIVLGAKLAIHMHCDWLIELPRAVARRRLRHADLILGVSEYITDGVREAFPELADRCRCLYNGADSESFLPKGKLHSGLSALAEENRARLGLGDGPMVMFASAMAPDTKGLEVLLPAFRRVLEHVPSAKLLVASGASIRYAAVHSPRTRRERREQRLRFKGYPAQIERLSAPLGSRLVLAGKIPYAELATYYALADVVAVPSVCQEPLSLVALEALSSGVPVVASARGGLPEIVLDGVTGRLVPAGDPVALADALTELCLDPELARRFGESGRRLIEERFTWPQRADCLADYCEELMGKRALALESASCPT